MGANAEVRVHAGTNEMRNLLGYRYGVRMPDQVNFAGLKSCLIDLICHTQGGNWQPASGGISYRTWSNVAQKKLPPDDNFTTNPTA
jgi:hypothetical protein